MTEFQIHDRLPSGFTYANDQQVARFVDTGSVNGASKVCLVATGDPEPETYLLERLADRAGVDYEVDLAIRLRPPRTIEDIESIGRRGITSVEQYRREYEKGWRASKSRSASMDPSTSHAWDDGYLDYAADRAKWHLTWCLDHDNCGEG